MPEDRTDIRIVDDRSRDVWLTDDEKRQPGAPTQEAIDAAVRRRDARLGRTRSLEPDTCHTARWINPDTGRCENPEHDPSPEPEHRDTCDGSDGCGETVVGPS